VSYSRSIIERENISNFFEEADVLVLGDIGVWAEPISVFLLIVLAITNAYIARVSERVHQEQIDIKRKMGINRRFHDDPHHNERTHDIGERRRVSDKRRHHD